MLVCSEILKILLREEKLDADMDIRQLAKQTEGFSGSDLKRKSICTFSVVDAHILSQIYVSLLH